MRAIPPRCYPDALPREQSHAPPRDEARAVARGDGRTEILNHHRTGGASSGPTEGQNFCAKQVKRAGRGITNFSHYRLRVLLYAGGVTWPVTVCPPRIRTTRRPH